MVATNELALGSLRFAEEIQNLLDRTLPGDRTIVSIEHKDRYVVRPQGEDPTKRHIPLKVNGVHLASLSLYLYQGLDRTGQYLKTCKTNFTVYSSLENNPLLRLEYDANMRTSPVSHWQVHAKRDAFTNLLTHAEAQGRVTNPHMLSSLHLPTGGERFRPSLEDLLEFLIRDCGIDKHDGWETAIQEGRKKWRRRQFSAAVRDLQEEAAQVLRNCDWNVQPPPTGAGEAWMKPYEQW